MTRTRANANAKTPPFVVYVTYPSSSKEYAYLCDFPAKQDDLVLGANGQKVKVLRTAATDDRAVRYVIPLPDALAVAREARRATIRARMKVIQMEDEELHFWKRLAKTNQEARKLLSEYIALYPSRKGTTR